MGARGLRGRAEERAALDAAWHDPACGAALVIGAAGAGKTRLLREFAATVEDAGCVVLWITASPATAAIPFGALAQALTELDGSDGFQVLRQTAMHVEALAERGPVIVVIDDTQDLDDSSTAVFLHLAQHRKAFIVGSWRSSPSPQRRERWWRDVASRRIELGAMDISETRLLIQSMLGGPIAEVTVARLHETSRGNPFFVIELVRGWAREGPSHHGEPRWLWSGQSAFTPRLHDLIGEHLARATEPVRTAVDYLAYAGPIPVEVVQDLSGITELLAADESGLIQTVSSARGREADLAHPLFGEIARSSMTVLGRQHLARGLCAAVEHGYAADPLRAASRLLDSGQTTSPQMLTAAARRAFAAFDLQLGLRLARAALDRGDPNARGVLTEILIESGDRVEANTLLTAVIDEIPVRAGNRDHARLYVHHAWNVTHGLHDPDRAQLALRDADQRLPECGDVLAAGRAHLAAYAGRPAEALHQADLALESDAPHPLSIIQAHIAQSFALLVAGRLEDAMAADRRASEEYTTCLGQTWSLFEEERGGALVVPRIFAGHLLEATAICERRLGMR